MNDVVPLNPTLVGDPGRPAPRWKNLSEELNECCISYADAADSAGKLCAVGNSVFLYAPISKFSLHVPFILTHGHGQLFADM